jgi:sn-glycerol 3-phosphate transport system substrate-binding protein
MRSTAARSVSLCRPRTRRLAVAALPFLLISACGGGGGKSASGGNNPAGSGTSQTTSAASLASQCPNGAMASAQKPIQITMWHSMTQANLTTLVKLTNEFNASHPDIHVNLVNQTSYTDTLTKYKAVLGGGPRPDLVQIQDVDQQLVIDSRSVLPAEACFEAKHLDTSDFVPRAISYYTVRGVQYSIPFAMSNPVFYYNKAAFQKAGLDPNKPPTTLDELRQDAQKIVSSGVAKYGIALKDDPWHLEEWSAMAGALYANNGNGRTARATAVEFGGATGQQIYSWISGMARDKLAESTPSTGFDNLLAIPNNVAAMTIDTSAALGTIFQVLGTGQYPNVQLGVAALPGLAAGGPTIQAGSSLFVVSGTSPAREEAAFTFAEWLSEGAQQAVWAAGTGYVPVRTSATSQPVLQQAWAARPQLRIAYDQILNGANDLAAQGPVIGDMEGVRTAVENAETELFQGADPTTTLQKLVTEANSVISDYESRI